MELFYSKDIDDGICRLDEEESGHCIRVLRHRAGDEINIIDGKGTLYRCRITDDSPKHSEALIIKEEKSIGLPYRLEMAVCPTKNADRFEWFAEKATEIGISSIVPVIGEHSERKIIKTERIEKIVLSAVKQSLKTELPQTGKPRSVKDYILSRNDNDNCLKLIACCFEEDEHPRVSIAESLRKYFTKLSAPVQDATGCTENSTDTAGQDERPAIAVLIGPEGDFSHDEVTLAIKEGWQPVHLGPSRLRTETAALTAVEAVYLTTMLFSDNLDFGVYTDLDD